MGSWGLTEGSGTMERAQVTRVVSGAYRRILKELDRAVVSVRGVGYRLISAGEHQMVAASRKRRSDVQFRCGLYALQHVRLEEMEPNARLAHEGMTLMMGALWNNQRAMEKRLQRVEDAIEASKLKPKD